MHRTRPVALTAVLAFALIVAACASPAATGTPATGAAASPGGGSAGASSGSSSSAAASDDASAGQASEAPADTTAPSTPKPTKTPKPSALAAASLDAGTAAACTGSDDNRTFFAGVAAQVDWTVVCAVLPKRWFVSSGSFRLAKGGKLLISYKVRTGRRCPSRRARGAPTLPGASRPARISGMPLWGRCRGRSSGSSGGGFAVSVGGGQPTSWLLETQGLDQATTVELAGAAVAVGS